MGCCFEKTIEKEELKFGNHDAYKLINSNAENPIRNDSIRPNLIKSPEDLRASQRGKDEKSLRDIKSSLDKSSLMKKPTKSQIGIKIHVKNIVNQKECSPGEFYIIEKKLGEGSYGEVFKVKHKNLGFVRAMKKIIRKTRSSENEKEVLNEIGLLKQIDHPNVVKIFEFYVTKQAYFLITEICSGGELFDRITENGPLEESQAAYVMYQLFSAVYNCHSLNILHRDLKPENILIDNEDRGFLNVKIIDFGTAKVFEKDKSEQKVIGSAYYIAPEVLEKSYNEKCDLWSCGVILYILLTAKPPFGGSDDEIIKKIKRGVYDESELNGRTKEVKDLIKHLLDMNPRTRYNAEQALKHDFFKRHETRKKLFSTSPEKFTEIISKLKNFKYQSKFQETALAFLVHNILHIEEVRDLYKVFSLIDDNLDGKITHEELRNTITNVYRSFTKEEVENEVNIIFKNIDNDNNGSIEYEEFVRAVIGKEKLLSEEILLFAFHFFDKDGSGDITIDEMQVIFGEEIDRAELEKLIKEIDINEDSQISFQEFKTMMLKLMDK